MASVKAEHLHSLLTRIIQFAVYSARLCSTWASTITDLLAKRHPITPEGVRIMPYHRITRMLVWRVDTGLSKAGLSAGDIAHFEQDELGNDLGIPPEDLAWLDAIPGKRPVWTCARQSDARRYGSHLESFFATGIVLAEDGDGGSLILLSEEEA